MKHFLSFTLFLIATFSVHSQPSVDTMSLKSYFKDYTIYNYIRLERIDNNHILAVVELTKAAVTAERAMLLCEIHPEKDSYEVKKIEMTPMELLHNTYKKVFVAENNVYMLWTRGKNSYEFYKSKLVGNSFEKTETPFYTIENGMKSYGTMMKFDYLNSGGFRILLSPKKLGGNYLYQEIGLNGNLLFSHELLSNKESIGISEHVKCGNNELILFKYKTRSELFIINKDKALKLTPDGVNGRIENISPIFNALSNQLLVSSFTTTGYEFQLFEISDHGEFHLLSSNTIPVETVIAKSKFNTSKKWFNYAYDESKLTFYQISLQDADNYLILQLNDFDQPVTYGEFVISVKDNNIYWSQFVESKFPFQNATIIENDLVLTYYRQDDPLSGNEFQLKKPTGETEKVVFNLVTGNETRTIE